MPVIAAMVLAAALPAQCRVLLEPRHAAQEVRVDDTAPQPCNARSPRPKLVFDAHKRILRAREALAAGSDLGRVYFPPSFAVHAGDRLALIAHVGYVAITRNVVALQDAVPGASLFVRDRDGEIFVVPLAQEERQP